MGHVHDLRCGDLELEHTSSNENGRSTETVGAPAGRNPGTVHRLKESSSVLHDIVTVSATKTEPVAEASNEETWVDERDLHSQVEFLHQLHVYLAKAVHIDLGNICKVNEEVG